jgi:hypothetical protein
MGEERRLCQLGQIGREGEEASLGRYFWIFYFWVHDSKVPLGVNPEVIFPAFPLVRTEPKKEGG